MKSTVVDESLSSNKTNVLFQRILQDFKINSTVWETYIKQYIFHMKVNRNTSNRKTYTVECNITELFFWFPIEKCCANFRFFFLFILTAKTYELTLLPCNKRHHHMPANKRSDLTSRQQFHWSLLLNRIDYHHRNLYSLWRNKWRNWSQICKITEN